VRKPAFTGPELCAKGAHEVVGLLRKREVSPAELLDAAFARIAATDGAINAVPVLCEDRARAHAANLSISLAKDDPAWLGGLPLAVKDLSNVKGVRTTSGSPAFADFVAAETDPLIALLEDRGGVVVGKSNTPEMGAGGNTFNPVLGRTRNPWNVAKNPGGSSGGAAASLAAGQVWLAHGSDHGGSLRTPAAYCGIVGLRPTPGRAGGGTKDLAYEREGMQGPMARDALDCALFLDAMSGWIPRLPLTLPRPDTSFQKAVLEADAPPRIAFSPDLGGYGPVEPEIRDALAAAMTALQGAGTVVEDACPDISGLYDTYMVLRGISQAAGPGKAPAHVQSGYKQTLAENIAWGRALTADRIFDAMRHRSTLYHRMLDFLEIHGMLAFPVVGLAPLDSEIEYPTHVGGVAMDGYMDWLRFAFLATTVGMPAISVPIGFTPSGMPVGLQILAPAREEARLLAAARVLEQVTDWRVGPIDPVGA
jgi:amidase